MYAARRLTAASVEQRVRASKAGRGGSRAGRVARTRRGGPRMCVVRRGFRRGQGWSHGAGCRAGTACATPPAFDVHLRRLYIRPSFDHLQCAVCKGGMGSAVCVCVRASGQRMCEIDRSRPKVRAQCSVIFRCLSSRDAVPWSKCEGGGAARVRRKVMCLRCSITDCQTVWTSTMDCTSCFSRLELKRRGGYV